MDDVTIKTPDDQVLLEGRAMERLMELLIEADQIDKRLARKSIDFADYLKLRSDAGTFPQYRVMIGTNGEQEVRYVYSEPDLKALCEQVEADSGLEIVTDAPNEPRTPHPGLRWTELFVAPDMARVIDSLGELGFSADQLLPGDSPRFVIEDGQGRTQPVKSLPELLVEIREQGRKNVDVQRYKGLGEMNPEQLWETTMKRENRKLLRVTMEDAVKADEMFTVLMGDEVEPRRAFIEANALNVTNLDV
jgi:DNA gyrase subunit B